MKTRFPGAITFALINLFSLNFLSAQETVSEKADSLFAGYNCSPSPGLAILVVKDGKVVQKKGFGMANLEYSSPITPSTVFDIASLSKQFTGMAISMLIEQGSIQPDGEIRTYIPEMPCYGHKITIEQLMFHTAGLRDWPGTLTLAGWNIEDVITHDQILNMAYHQQELNFEPGSTHLYSNTGYNILAELVERVSGKSFRQWTDSCIFLPLGMKNTHFRDDYSELIENRAYGYYEQQNQYHAALDNLTAVGSSSLFTTLDDLSKWLIHLDDPKIESKSVVNRMFQQGKLNNDSLITYAYGFEILKYRGLKEISHSGSWASCTSYLVYYPEEHLSIAVLSNGSAKVKKATHDLADIFLPGNTTNNSAQANPAPVFSKSPETHQDKKAVTSKNAQWAWLSGEYYSKELETSYDICVEKDRLVAKHFKNGTIGLTPAGNDQFTGSAWFMDTVEFYCDKKGQIQGFMVSSGRSQKQRFEKRR
jgi:CubicO group peptidase (beta-lactamase class C family)